MRATVLGLLLMAVNIVAQASDPQWVELRSRLAATAVVRGEFTQQRSAPDLPRPLISSGTFVYWRDHGVRWVTERPLPQITVYRSDATLQQDDPAASPRKIKGRRARAFRRVLLDVFSFDEVQLASQFEQQWTILADDRWRLTLEPSGGLKRALASVELSGGTTIDRLKITDTDGRVLVMEFLAQQHGGQIDAKACEALFFYSAKRCASTSG